MSAAEREAIAADRTWASGYAAGRAAGRREAGALDAAWAEAVAALPEGWDMAVGIEGGYYAMAGPSAFTWPPTVVREKADTPAAALRALAARLRAAPVPEEG